MALASVTGVLNGGSLRRFSKRVRTEGGFSQVLSEGSLRHAACRLLFSMGAKTYQELDVWRLCEEIRVLVLAKTETPPALGDRKFCNQIRDAAEDAASDAAEG